MAVFECVDSFFLLLVTLSADFLCPFMNSLVFGGWRIPALTGTSYAEYEEAIDALRSKSQT